MINLNPAIEQKINQFILKVKLAHQKEARDIIQETKNLKDELIQIQRLGELTFSENSPIRVELEEKIIAHTDQLVETINLLSTGKILETPLDTFSQETDSLVATITILFDANANDANLPKLKEKLTAWQTKIKDTLLKFYATVELQQKNESLIAELKDKLSKYSSVDEDFQKLINEFKNNFAQLQEASVLFKSLDDLINEIQARDEGIKLNQRIDTLLEKTKEQVAGFPPKLDWEVQKEIQARYEGIELEQRIDILLEKTKEQVAGFTQELDREVQGELAKLIKILGMAQVELKNISKPCDIMQVKSVVDSGEIAIKSLTGKPNIILAQKLRYAARTRLRKIQKNCSYNWYNNILNIYNNILNIGEDLYHYLKSLKTPAKVLIGLVLALPLNWGIMNSPPVKNLLMSLPPITKSSNQNTAGKSNQDTEGKSNQNIEEKDENFKLLILMTGTLGGAVSLLTRLQDFDNPKNQKYDDDLVPLMIAATKPILGGSFAFFILLILNSSISPLEIRGKTEEKNDNYLYGLLTMAFVAGFSERLIPDLINQVEKRVTVEASSTGQGLPPAILIAPPSASLALNGIQEFTINPVGNYTITISPPESGKIDKNTTDAKFTYTAPAQGNPGDKITITATSDSGQTAKATVTLTA